MKRFQFRLQTALDWRSRRKEIEQARLQVLLEELGGTEAALRRISEGAVDAQNETYSAGQIAPGALTALERHRAHLQRERARVLERRVDCEKNVAAQRERLIEAERAVRLLEKLKERRLTEWNVEANKELESLTAESFMARWSRSTRSRDGLDDLPNVIPVQDFNASDFAPNHVKDQHPFFRR
ncbi:MAG TPA: hypothetical protein VN428_11410 [Bryobacteraceae bacterium]|nr:hypothetical protein [Bryobacteraceae bacterium]